MFERRLQGQMTMTGQGKGIVFRLRRSHILAVMIDGVRKNHPSSLVQDVEQMIAGYLRHARDRKGGLPRIK